MSELLRCRNCGGQVVYDVVERGVACLFCGAVSLAAVDEGEDVPEPDAQLLRLVDPARAEEAYRAWAAASWWRPAKLRSLRIGLQQMLLPGWSFKTWVSSHWAGLERASTRSGKRPVTGTEGTRLVHMVPASGGLTAQELSGLMPFSGEDGPWDPKAAHAPYEVPARSRRSAASEAHQLMDAAHRERIAGEHGLVTCKTASLFKDREARLLMLPIYIGTFRYRDRPWRFLVNGQTGEVVGEAPVDRGKVALVALAVLALVTTAWALLP